MLRVPADPDAVFDFLDTGWRTIQHYGVEVNGLRYNGPVLRRHVGAQSPYGGVNAGRWRIRVNARDVRYACLQDPDDAAFGVGVDDAGGPVCASDDLTCR